MKPDSRFTGKPASFWACVRAISQHAGYTQRDQAQVKVPSVPEMRESFARLALAPSLIADDADQATALATDLQSYLEYRAQILNAFVEPHLMDVARAKAVFQDLRRKLRPRCPLPMNKQKGEKKTPAYFTGIINMLIEDNAQGFPCDFELRALPVITKHGIPAYVLARRVDGAFPSALNPIAVWEIKEYYYTTTFGSRVADAVYETLLDGMEIELVRQATGVYVRHYLMVDSHYTWWECGRSYLCRIVDTLHMGYLDEVLFGSEVVDTLPGLVRQWVTAAKRAGGGR